MNKIFYSGNPITMLRRSGSPLSSLLGKIEELDETKRGMLSALHSKGRTRYEFGSEALTLEGRSFPLNKSGLDDLRLYLARA